MDESLYYSLTEEYPQEFKQTTEDNEINVKLEQDLVDDFQVLIEKCRNNKKLLEEYELELDNLKIDSSLLQKEIDTRIMSIRNNDLNLSRKIQTDSLEIDLNQGIQELETKLLLNNENFNKLQTVKNDLNNQLQQIIQSLETLANDCMKKDADMRAISCLLINNEQELDRVSGDILKKEHELIEIERKISNLKMVILRLQKNIDRFSFIVDIENKQVAIENETKNLIFDNHARTILAETMKKNLESLKSIQQLELSNIEKEKIDVETNINELENDSSTVSFERVGNSILGIIKGAVVGTVTIPFSMTAGLAIGFVMASDDGSSIGLHNVAAGLLGGICMPIVGIVSSIQNELINVEQNYKFINYSKLIELKEKKDQLVIKRNFFNDADILRLEENILREEFEIKQNNENISVLKSGLIVELTKGIESSKIQKSKNEIDLKNENAKLIKDKESLVDFNDLKFHLKTDNKRLIHEKKDFYHKLRDLRTHIVFFQNKCSILENEITTNEKRVNYNINERSELENQKVDLQQAYSRLKLLNEKNANLEGKIYNLREWLNKNEKRLEEQIEEEDDFTIII